MKILIISEVFRPGLGGVQTALDTLVSGLVAAGDSVTIMTGSPRGIRSYYEESYLGARIIRIPAFKSPINPDNNRVTFFPGRYVRRYFRSETPDIVHIHTPASWLHNDALKQARRRNIPIVVTNHAIANNLLMNKNSWIFRKLFLYANILTTRLLGRVTLITAPTQAALKEYPRLTVPCTAISNGVDTAYYCPGTVESEVYHRFNLDVSRPIVLHTGRLDGEKRIDLLIDAFRRLHQDNRVRPQLVIVGKGLLESVLREQARPLGDDCHFTGFVSDEDKVALLRAADVLALVGPAELQGISGLEALACGTPLVVADQLALPELVDSGRNGFTYVYPDSTDLAKKLTTLLQSDSLRKRLSRQGRQWVVEHHAVARTIDQYRQVYRQAISEVRPKHR